MNVRTLCGNKGETSEREERRKGGGVKRGLRCCKSNGHIEMTDHTHRNTHAHTPWHTVSTNNTLPAPGNQTGMCVYTTCGMC